MGASIDERVIAHVSLATRASTVGSSAAC